VLPAPVQGAVGEPHERVAVAGAGELAEARGDAHADVVDRRRALEHDSRLLLLGLGHQQGELVAADPRQQVLAAQQPLQAGFQRRQHAIAGRVAGEVVDRLEVVDIDQRQRAVMAERAGDFSVQPLLEA
jgi:hypothetical protein